MNMENAIMSFSLDELKRRRLDMGKLLSISYSTSGGMLGIYHDISLSFEDYSLKVTDRVNYKSDNLITFYKTDKDTVDKIKEMIIENNLPAWKEIPVDRSKFMTDVPTSKIILRYEENTIDISTLINVDKEEKKILNKISELVNSMIKDENVYDHKMENQSLFSMLGQADSNIKLPAKFCPECGKPKEENSNNCTCGHIFD